MQQDSEKPKEAFRWGTPASILIHAAIAAAFLINIPARQATPEQEQAVNVELVPPPQEKKPEGKKPEEAKKEEKKPEQPKPPEKPPEPPKVEAKKEDPPPPTPPPPKPPEPPKEQAKEQPKPQAPPPPIPAMRQVYEFGDEDSGPEKTDKGDAAQAEVKPADGPTAAPPKAVPEPAKPLGKPPAASPVPQDIELPKVQAADAHAGKDGPAATGTDEAKTTLETEKPEETKPDQADASEAKADVAPPEEDKLKRVKTLASHKGAASKNATTAMGNLSRGLRVGQLCMTELHTQLQQATPGYSPVQLPSFQAPDGNVFTISRGAFLNSDGWRLMNFRCEVNGGGTKVVSFEFGVGGHVPRSEYQSFRIPAGGGY